MSLSVVHFRMHHGKEMDQIVFNGNGIKLLDLKKEIVEKKNITGTLDFDLKIVDENKKEYIDDDEVIPKNASLIVRRVPAKNSKTSLIARLNNRAALMSANNAGDASQNKPDIIMSVKAEELESKRDASDAEDGDDEDVLNLMAQEEGVLKRTAPVGTSWSNNTDATAANVPPQQNQPMKKPVITYPCLRCNKLGHNAKFCPTIGDSKFDPEIRLLNIPRASRKRVASLEGIDSANKTVIENKDGTYDIIETSTSGVEQLQRDAESQIARNINMAEVPDRLKCALNGSFLHEAVALPCCQKVVNDSTIRDELIRSGLRCPLCRTDNVSPDSLFPMSDIREQVSAFIEHHKKINTGDKVTRSDTSEDMEQSVGMMPPPPPPAGLPPTSISTHAPPIAPALPSDMSSGANPNPSMMHPPHPGMPPMPPPMAPYPMMYGGAAGMMSNQPITGNPMGMPPGMYPGQPHHLGYPGFLPPGAMGMMGPPMDMWNPYGMPPPGMMMGPPGSMGNGMMLAGNAPPLPPGSWPGHSFPMSIPLVQPNDGRDRDHDRDREGSGFRGNRRDSRGRSDRRPYDKDRDYRDKERDYRDSRYRDRPSSSTDGTTTTISTTTTAKDGADDEKREDASKVPLVDGNEETNGNRKDKTVPSDSTKQDKARKDRSSDRSKRPPSKDRRSKSRSRDRRDYRRSDRRSRSRDRDDNRSHRESRNRGNEVQVDDRKDRKSEEKEKSSKEKDDKPREERKKEESGNADDRSDSRKYAKAKDEKNRDDRSKDKDRERVKDKERDKDRGRDRDDDKDREKKREREKEKDRGDREKDDMGRDRDRDREREKSKKDRDYKDYRATDKDKDKDKESSNRKRSRDGDGESRDVDDSKYNRKERSYDDYDRSSKNKDLNYNREDTNGKKSDREKDRDRERDRDSDRKSSKTSGSTKKE